MLLTQASKMKPNVLIKSQDQLTQKVLNLYKDKFEPVGKTMIVWFNVTNEEALNTIDNLTSKGYDIIFNVSEDYKNTECNYII